MSGVSSTRGHSAGNGGLRGHSCGDVFPYIIVACGHPDSLTYQVWCPDGTKSKQYGSYDEAYRIASWHKECDDIDGMIASSREAVEGGVCFE